MSGGWSPRRQAAKDALKKVIPVANRVTERIGVRLQPVHYYSEVPDRQWLREHRGSWTRPVVPAGLTWDVDAQLAWLEKITAEHLPEVVGLTDWRALGTEHGPGFGPIESQILHGVLRSTAPQRLVEVGSGVSTALAHRAVERNRAEGRSATSITCVEPYPRPALHALEGVRVVEQGAQDVDASVFEELGAGDVLFIDSTHAVRTGSEVARLYLEVLPRLEPGVLVHVHDVFLPYLFAPDVLDSIFDWQETTLLAALLTDNPRLEVLACLSAVHHARPGALATLFPDYHPRPMRDGLDVDVRAQERGTFPSSLWLTTV